MVPTVVETSGRLDLARGLRIISLVLEAFNCMSLLSVHLSKLIKKAYVSESDDFGWRTSDKVESSTYKWTFDREVINKHQERQRGQPGTVTFQYQCLRRPLAERF